MTEVQICLLGVRARIRATYWVAVLLYGLVVTECRPHALALLPFVLATTAVLVVHELGHVVVGRLVGKRLELVLNATGPHSVLADGETPNMGGGEVLLTLLGGVAASLLLVLGLGVALLLVAPGSAEALAWGWGMLFGEAPEALAAGWPPLALLWLVYGVQVAVVWLLLNALPIYPFDGGLVLRCIIGSERRANILSLGLTSALALGALAMGWWWVGGGLMWLALMSYYRAFMRAQDDEGIKRS